jgi:hypothetical protein
VRSDLIRGVVDSGRVKPLFGLWGVNMGNGERSGSGGRGDGPVRLATGVGTCTGAAVALFVVKPLVELPLWLGLLAFLAVSGVGGVLGRLVGRLLFRPSSGGPPEHPPHG